MATKYILQSGAVRNYPEKKKLWHDEIMKTAPKSPRVLICMFSMPRELWEEKYPVYCDSFREDMPAGGTPLFKMASPQTFIEESQWADIIYCLGGDDALVSYWLGQFNLESIWRNKIVCVNSASSDALATHYFTCDWRLCRDGLAVLPIKFLPHYKSDYGATDPRGPVDWDRALTELKEYGDTTLPVHALKEGDFIVIEQ